MYNPYTQLIEQIDQQIKATQELATDPEMADLAKLEITKLEAEKQQLVVASEQLEQSEDSPKSTVQTNCIIEIRQGTGGEEAKIWGDDLLRMYVRSTELLGLKIQYVDDMVIKITGKVKGDADQLDELIDLTPYEVFQFETGVHRVQRVPETEAQGRIHTSTATVAVLPEVPKTAVVIKDDDLEWQFMRAGGAGGQSVNKTSSAVRLIHKPTGLVTTARSERSQIQNRETALELLRAILWEIEEEKQASQVGAARAGIGRAQRAEKIRTYNFPQNRVTDHRTKQSWYNLPEILEGQIVDLLTRLRQEMIKMSNQSQEPTHDQQKIYLKKTLIPSS